MDPIFPAIKVNTPAIVTSSGKVMDAHVTEAAGKTAKIRRGWTIQNVGTGPLFVRLGGAASATVFHFVLKGGTGDSDGNGGSVSQSNGAVFQGEIYIYGTTPKAVITELT